MVKPSAWFTIAFGMLCLLSLYMIQVGTLTFAANHVPVSKWQIIFWAFTASMFGFSFLFGVIVRAILRAFYILEKAHESRADPS